MLQKLSRLAFLWAVCQGAAVRAGEWPAYKHDAERSSVTAERLTLPMTPVWVWRGTAPAPAWNEPGRSLNPLDFDYASQPVVADGVVVLASSADDTLRAFDAATGAIRWQVTAGGPVRFAPQLVGGRCFFAGDDGVVRCLDLATGGEIWSKRLGVNGSQVIANGRVASRWPCRSGVLVREGVLYVTAGMWPSEGVFIFALDAATGRERWCNDTSCYQYIEYPHVPSASFGGPAPQGALLATADVLLVPTGRGVPAAYDLKTGRFLHYTAGSEVGHKGGTWATVFDGTVFVTAVGWMPDVPPRLGESPEHFADSLAAFDARTGKEEWPLTAAMKAVAPEWKEPHWRGQIGAGLLGRTRAVFTPGRIFAFGNGKADAWDVKNRSATLAWSKPCPRVYAEALTPEALLLGEDRRVVAVDPRTGQELWQAPAGGEVRGLAVADGRIFATTDRGVLHVFAVGAPHPVTAPQVAPAAATEQPQALPVSLNATVEPLRDARGFAVVFGGSDASLAQGLAARTQLHVVTVLADARAVASERTRLARTGIYGSRLAVLAAGDLELPSYFAGLVVTVGDAAGVAPAEWYRVLRPGGGVLCAAAGVLKPPADVPPGEIQNGRVVRGRLAGAFDWDGKVEADERVKWPLEFTWFGEPNGQLQKARHTRPRTPLAATGRLFVFGENTVLALDAYSGVELWRRRFDTATGQDAPAHADDQSFYLAVGSAIGRFDAATGRLVEAFSDKPLVLPVIDARKPLHVDGAMRPGAACAMGIENTPDALRLVLSARSASPQDDDAWELAFDFRPPAGRVLAPGPGTFQLVVSTRGELRALPTFPHPTPQVEKRPDGRVAVSFAWKDLEQFAGVRPTEFLLAADCKLWNGKLDLALWDRPLTSGRGKGFNDAEAVILLAGVPAAQSDKGVMSPYLPVPVRPLAACPWTPQKDKLAGLPLLAQRRPNADLSDFGARAAQDAKDASLTALPRAKGFELPSRRDPFSDATKALAYTPSYGCSGIISSAVIDFMRSGCIGLYDRADDSGMRNISGIRSGCGQTLMPALGMLLYAEGTGNCLCTYNYATSFGMAPTGRRRNEDWALFNDDEAENAALQRIAFNIGAPGDRRDADGTLWLAFPRPALAMKLGTSVALPVSLDATPAPGPVRINTDRHAITGTDKPWLYGSNLGGIQRLRIDLQYYKPGGTCLSVGAKAPTIDGDLTDPCWDGFGGTPAGKEATLWMRHDAQNLYIAATALAGGKLGSFSIAFGDSRARTIVGITVAGGRLDAKRLEVPEFDRKADPRTLPDLTSSPAELPGVRAAARGNSTEIAIPWAALKALGLDRAALRASPNPLTFFGRKPGDVTRNFGRTSFHIKPINDPLAPAHYTVRLHFCEIEGAAAKQRVFDVVLNGRVVAKGLDIAAVVGPMKALVKEFRGVDCGDNLAVEFRSSNREPQAAPPLLSAIEVIRE